MNAEANRAVTLRAAVGTHRVMRQIHLWIGAWGALAAVMYGSTGFVMNHRFALNLPQGESVDAGQDLLRVPPDVRTSPDTLLAWLEQTHGLPNALIRGLPTSASQTPAAPWRVSGGDARASWSAEYTPGTESLNVRHSRQSWLAALNRLHKTVGGGTAWIILSDSFALAMTLLGISGLWMWARGRRPRTVVLSVLGVSLLTSAFIVGPALL